VTTISACVANENGQVRIVKAGATCRRGETATSWNTTGPAGAAGLAGPAGPAGPQGTAGSSGGAAFTVTAEVGIAAPQLMNAIVTNETLSTVVISLYKAGTTTVGTTITLTNASVSNFANNCNTAFPNCETAAFTYQKITWTWVDGGISASDDWEAPVS
jgi:type VI secretion system secreted protein Hcp